ncbi:MAG: hypothetical protein OHK0017_04480 [Patescibacteria group bacterium]
MFRSKFVNLVFALCFISIAFAPKTILAESGGFITDFIQINASQRDNKLNIEYLVLEGLYDPENRHGLFLSLPKNQAGIWTEYKLLSVERSPRVNCEKDLPSADNFLKCFELLDQNLVSLGDSAKLVPENNEQFKEWNEFRVRLGNKDVNLDPGTYFYKISIEATIDISRSYNFSIINDWNDPIQSSKFIFNGQVFCQDSACETKSNTIKLNPEKPPVEPYLWYLHSLWPYLPIFISSSLLAYYLWFKFARDPKQEKIESPEFEPPEILPWEAQYLISEGYVGVKNVLLSYILWLNHRKYIELKPAQHLEEMGIINQFTQIFTKQDKIQIKVIKNLPEILPAIFNQTILAIESKGLQAGVLETKIGPEKSGSSLNDHVKSNCAKYYSQLPSSTLVLITSIGGAVLLFFVLPMMAGILQQMFLLGNSYIWLAYAAVIWTLPQFIFIAVKWGRLNQLGIQTRTSVRQYKYYLEKAEKLKLDFSNNPEDGVQYYLKSVPYAAAFGILDKFQKYIESLALYSDQYNTTNLLNSSFHSVSFYTSSSSSSGGGGGGASGGGGGW